MEDQRIEEKRRRGEFKRKRNFSNKFDNFWLLNQSKLLILSKYFLN